MEPTPRAVIRAAVGAGGGCMEAAAAAAADRVGIEEKSQSEETEREAKCGVEPNAGWSSIALLVPAEKRGAEMG